MTPARPDMPHRRAAAAQRGLSLLEVALVIAVVGIIVGATLIPLTNLAVADVYEREQEKMEDIHTAILGYAYTHRTAGGQTVRVNPGDDERLFTMPGGRPYLPCPDITGDGYEDRGFFDATGSADNIAPGDTAPFHQVGKCAVSRGVLPWKTLGVPPHDGWGNRYTYAVDDVFADAIVGFGQDDIADDFDIRLTVTITPGDRGDFQYSRRAPIGITITRAGGDIVYTNTRRPIIVCGAETDMCLRALHADVNNEMFLTGGEWTRAAIPTIPRRPPLAGDVIQGVSYVVVSHGKNGRGAVNHAANILLYDNTENAVACNAPQNGGGGESAPPAGMMHEATNFPLVDGIGNALNTGCAPVTMLETGHFIAQPRISGAFAGESGDKANFDDIVEWRTPQQMLDELGESGLFPVEAFPVLRPY